MASDVSALGTSLRIDATHPSLPGQLDDDVERDDCENDEEKQEEPRVFEARQSHRAEQR